MAYGMTVHLPDSTQHHDDTPTDYKVFKGFIFSSFGGSPFLEDLPSPHSSNHAANFHTI